MKTHFKWGVPKDRDGVRGGLRVRRAICRCALLVVRARFYRRDRLTLPDFWAAQTQTRRSSSVVSRSYRRVTAGAAEVSRVGTRWGQR